MSSRYQFLSGVRVLELCWVWSGPLLGQYLGDLGAEVIKLEWYSRFDLYRTRGVERMRGIIPEARRRESSLSFHSLNRNKIGLAVNLKTAEGVQLVYELVKHCDLLIENFTVGTLERLGLSPEKLREANPRLSIVSLSAAGYGSPLENLRAYGLVLSSLAGAEVRFEDGGEFVGSPTFVVSDPNASLFGLLASLMGLLHAARTGEGTTFRGSQLEAVANLVRADRHAGADDPHRTEDTLIECDDGSYVAVSTPSGRSHDVQSLRTADETIEAVREAGGYAAQVEALTSARSSPVYRDLEVRLQSTHPVTGPEEIIAAPWRVDGRRPPQSKTAPVLGDGNDYVLSRILGLPDDEIERLKNAGVL